MYNISSMTGAQNLMQLAQGTSAVTGYLFGNMTLLLILIVPFLALKSKGYTSATCFAVGCWLVTITAIFLRPMDLIANYTFWLSILATPISVAVLYLSGNVD